MSTTKEWLASLLVVKNDDNRHITRNGITWKYVTGFSQCGNIFAIYKNDSNYCVHSADEWKEDEEPNMGYYDIDYTYNDLLTEIANVYDKIRINIPR